MTMNDADGKKWLKQVIVTNLITLIVAGAIFYGITITTNANQDNQIQKLDESKANKELVEHQYNEIKRELKNLRDDMKTNNQ